MQDVVFFVMNHLFLSFVWCISFFLAIIFSIKHLYLQSKLINNFFAIELINKKNAIVIDTRSLQLYESGHVINAFHIPFEKICSKVMQELNISKSSPIILIINTLENHNKYIKKFIKYGFNDIYILKNGMDLWNQDNLPIIFSKKK